MSLVDKAGASLLLVDSVFSSSVDFVMLVLDRCSCEGVVTFFS